MVKTSGLLDLYDPPRIRGRNLFWDELGDLLVNMGQDGVWCVILVSFVPMMRKLLVEDLLGL